MSQPATPMDTLTGDYLRRRAELDPNSAVGWGLAAVPPGLTDYGPEAAAARAGNARELLAAVAVAPVESERDRIVAETVRERLSVELEEYEAGEWMRQLRVIGSPMHATRRVFELLPRDRVEDWEDLADRLEAVPGSLASFQVALQEGVRRGVVAARRQATACAGQAATFADGYFADLVSGAPSGPLRDRLERSARAADLAYADLAGYLGGEYASAASQADGVGRDRYALACRKWTGLELDLEETYAWGWAELRRIGAEMAEVAELITPGEGVDAAIALLDTDPARSIEGLDAFIGWLQELMDATVEQLAGVHFDIPDPIRRVQACVAPPGSAAAMYYTRPSEDFHRPGRTWYPDLGRTRIPLWVEVSTAYHEGVPGHHLQLGYTTWLGGRLNPFQTHLGSVSGHLEGWALYAERLMGELGYLENPDYRMGMLAGQAHRAARVVVDIGLHLGWRIPEDAPAYRGESWTPELAVPFMVAAGRRPEKFMASEVDRYLGWPGQAISYKVGERVWLATRERVRADQGGDFDLRSFHQRAFGLGLVGLGQLERELTRDGGGSRKPPSASTEGTT